MTLLKTVAQIGLRLYTIIESNKNDMMKSSIIPYFFAQNGRQAMPTSTLTIMVSLVFATYEGDLTVGPVVQVNEDVCMCKLSRVPAVMSHVLQAIVA